MKEHQVTSIPKKEGRKSFAAKEIKWIVKLQKANFSYLSLFVDDLFVHSGYTHN